VQPRACLGGETLLAQSFASVYLVHTYTYIHTDIHTYIHTSTLPCVFVFVYLCMCSYWGDSGGQAVVLVLFAGSPSHP
jgi:hypothetical protein